MKIFLSIILLLLLHSACQIKESNVYDENGQLNTTTITIENPLQIASIWNDAINNRRWDVLNGLYADNLYYYKNKRPKSKCIESKIRATEKNEHFSQSIEDVNLVQTYFNTYEIYFQKAFTSGEKRDTILGFLSVTKDEEKGWQIIQESDLITSRNKGNKICNCSDFWIALYNDGDPSYYLLSGGWEGEIVYIGADGRYWLHVEYYDKGYIHYITKEDRPTHTTRLEDSYKFDLQKEVMTQHFISDDEEKGSIQKYNKRFYKRLKEFCK